MGDIADYYRETYETTYDIEDDDDAPVWVTRDRRVIPIRDMDDQHLANTIRFLQWRGARTPEEVKNNPLAAAEFALSRFTPEEQKKYVQLLEEKARREKLSPPNNSQRSAR